MKKDKTGKRGTKVLNLMLKKDEIIKIGDNISIKLQGHGSAQLAIDAPREINIKRIGTDGTDMSSKKKGVVVNNSTIKDQK